mgnify:CR=1 FL=1
MPLHDYECSECEEKFEVYQKYEEEELTVYGHFFLRAVSQDHCKEIKSPHMLQFEKNTESFLETMSIIKDKMIRIKEILDE